MFYKNDKNTLTKIFYKNGQRKTDREKVLQKATECTNEIYEAKKNYILKVSKKLEDSHTAPKTYWTILNHLIYNKTFPVIPPLFVDGNVISDFYAKANMFNNYFASICTTIKKRKCSTTFFIQNKHKSKFF